MILLCSFSGKQEESISEKMEEGSEDDTDIEENNRGKFLMYNTVLFFNALITSKYYYL